MFDTLIDSLLGLLFPDRCAGCERLGALFCATCRAALQPYPADRNSIPGIDGTLVAYIFGGALQPAIHALKYDKRRRVARPLGALMGDLLRQRPLAADGLLPVPLHGSRERERGFNQSHLLAQQIAPTHRLPLLTGGLVRVRATEQQARLDARARRANMRDAFAWRSSTPPPPRIIIIDDVLTTGATVAACADALRAAGARQIYALALARSRPDQPFGQTGEQEGVHPS